MNQFAPPSQKVSTAKRLPEVAALLAVGAMAWATYAYVTSEAQSHSLLHPTVIAVIMVLNLVPAMAMIVLVGSRVARTRAVRSLVGGNGRLHVQLVVLFSIIAAISTFMVVIFASLLFQMGVNFWFSDQSRGLFENAADLAEGYYQENHQEVEANSIAMAHDISDALRRMSFDTPDFVLYYFQQVVIRNLNRSEIIEIGADGVSRRIAMVDPTDRTEERKIPEAIIRRLNADEKVLTSRQGNRIESVTKLDVGRDVYLFASRDEQAMNLGQLNRANIILEDYNMLFNRSRQLQVQFNLALYLGSLLFVMIAVVAGIVLADRLVRPVGLLIRAARTAAGGDLSVRVDVAQRKDEIAVLSSAFNSMTERLQAQTNALMRANHQLDTRRTFIETILGGVSSAIMSLDSERRIQLANRSAVEMTGLSHDQLIGQTIDSVVPALAAVIDSPRQKTVLQLTKKDSLSKIQGDITARGSDISKGQGNITIAAKAVALHDGGHALSFDDITQQLHDQRRAAWSDVARRIAHEIKNPLTPIQLAAERLQHRFGEKLTGEELAKDADLFQNLTDNIIRHVNDMRRMLDEFSSFARMPKPIFDRENLIDVVRRSVLLFEVARPDIDFCIDSAELDHSIICDRQLLSQAFTNVIKNAIEAIDESCAQRKTIEGNTASKTDSLIAAREAGTKQGNGRIHILIAYSRKGDGNSSETDEEPCITIAIADNGIGLPEDRDAIIEPYMTTRQGGTGLGLAIVKKIVSEHLGQMSFVDVSDGGSCITFHFYPERLQKFSPKHSPDIKPVDVDVPGRIRNRSAQNSAQNYNVRRSHA